MPGYDETLYNHSSQSSRFFYRFNVKLQGPGKYKLKFMIAPPSANKHAHFGRHTDRATGVRPWFKPFEVEYEFTFAGIGKKGGY